MSTWPQWWIEDAIKHADCSIAELSRKSGISTVTIWKILQSNNKNGFRSDVVEKLVKACGCEIPPLRTP